MASMNKMCIFERTLLEQKVISHCQHQLNAKLNYGIFPLGKWSAPVPRCELVKCESLTTPGGLYEPHLELEEHNNSFGGRAVFSCAWGYRLMGPPGIECELNGNWSGPLPKCVRKYVTLQLFRRALPRGYKKLPERVQHDKNA